MVLLTRTVTELVTGVVIAGILGAGAASPGLESRVLSTEVRPTPGPGEPPAQQRGGSSDAAGTQRLSAVGACRSLPAHGPARKPAGAVRVSGRLDEAVARRPAGTTFWLTPGVHRLGSAPYDQVSPKNGDTIIGAPGAVLDGGRTNHYAFGGRATNVRIAHLTVRHFGTSVTDDFNEGVVNHDAGHRWRIDHVTVRDNAGAGVLLGSGGVLAHSCLSGNGQYGFNVYEDAGVSNIRLIGNEIVGNATARWEKRQPGCGCSGGGKLWATRGAVIRGNSVRDNLGVGIWADTDNTGFLVAHNQFSGNADAGLEYEISYNARIVHNTFRRNALVSGPLDPGFPHAALYLSESGADHRAGARYGHSLVVGHNDFEDNWSGVVLWENADRFAGSPANTSTGVTTLVSPHATVAACGDPAAVSTAPLVDDCRWKTQHVRVRHNRFRLDARRVGHGCPLQADCGFVGVFSNFGSYPDWSPYRGSVVEDAITFDQDNRFADNEYVGPWRFMVKEQGHVVSWHQWRAAPYGQDRGSVRRR